EKPAMSFFRERCDLIEIAALRIDDKQEHARLAEGIGLLCEQAKLSLNLHSTDNAFGRLIHAAGGQRALAIMTATLAVLHAARSGSSRLELSHFRAVYEEHTGSSDPNANPFVAESWHTVETQGLARTVTMSITEQLRNMNRPAKETTNV